MKWKREGLASSSAGSGAQVNIAATNGTFGADKIYIRNVHGTLILYVGVNNTSLSATNAIYRLPSGSAGIEVSLAPGDTLNTLGSDAGINTTFIYNRMRLK